MNNAANAPAHAARTPSALVARMVAALLIAGSALPATAQTDLFASTQPAAAQPAPSPSRVAAPAGNTANPALEARLRQLEAQMRAVQRKVFPDGAGKTFAPEIAPPDAAQTPAAAPAAPETTPLADILNRIESLEAQVRQLTAATEENGNHLRMVDKRLDAIEAAAAAAAPPPAPVATPAPPPPSPVTAIAAPRSAVRPAPARGRGMASPVPAGPPPADDRVAAVAAIDKPQTGDADDDGYTYGFRLFDAHFYPEAAIQLAGYLDQFAHGKHVSQARNLLGRAYLEDNKPGEAARTFLKNYLGDKHGDRAADSLLYLGIAMTRINDVRRACGAFAEFRTSYPDERAGRLKSVYDSAIKAVTCD